MNSFSIQSRRFHFLATFLLMMFIVCFQSMVLAKSTSPWLHIDLVTIFVVYVSIEHYLLSALVKVMSAAMLMHSFSAAPMGFYVMYFLLALVFSGFLSRRLVLYNRLSQFLSFAGIFVLKFFLMYFALIRQTQDHSFGSYFVLAYPTLLVTIVLAVPLFRAFSTFDELFEFYSLRDRAPEIEV